jgi:hypothetical protein
MEPRRKIKFVNILLYIALVGLDVLVFLILSLLLMSYEDHYDGTRGMTMLEKTAYISINLWYVTNAVLIGYIIVRAFKSIRNSNR